MTHVPDGLTMAPIRRSSEGEGAKVIMSENGQVERPFFYIRQDFFLARSFRNLNVLDLQLQAWLDAVPNVRLRGTTQCVVSEAFAEGRPRLHPPPVVPFRAVLRLERRGAREDLVSVGGNLYGLPDRTRRPAGGAGRGQPVFQLVNARYERSAMILTSETRLCRMRRCVW
jgi:hypothetical protein